jgi:type III restriction enzyme
LFPEEVAQVLGVPFEIVPFKGTGGTPVPAPKRFHVKALEERGGLEIRFPRVDGYTQAVKSRVAVDWKKMPHLVLKPGEYPTLVDMKGVAIDSAGRAVGLPGTVREMTHEPFFEGMRIQRGVFEMASALTKNYLAQRETTVPAHALFPQLEAICRRFVMEFVDVPPTAQRVYVFQAPYYTWAVEILLEQIQPDVSAGESPELPRFDSLSETGSTAEVDFWTSKDVRAVDRSHVNYVVADTAAWEQQAAFYINRHRVTDAFVKNAGLGFTIPYMHNGEMHDFIPDFIVRLKSSNGHAPAHLILETKGYDPLREVKEAAASRWVNAVNADGRFGAWSFRMANSVSDVSHILEEAAT